MITNPNYRPLHLDRHENDRHDHSQEIAWERFKKEQARKWARQTRNTNHPDYIPMDDKPDETEGEEAS